MSNVPLEQQFPIPFVLAEQPRMMLNFLALHSNIPDRYREMIAEWLLQYNTELGYYIGTRYGMDALQEADLIASAMAMQFLEVVAQEREAADKQMFDGLEQEIFGDGLPE
ncbi:hypothetical protein SEA_ESTES_69 [Mycobacterium phage Estes]|uniref:Uncharacterized protein n=2 Tax=Reyvirus TaxID=1623301 RepID=A0A7G9A2D9_9CAUD|nr:hypothetical protein J4U03_gp069 [Mycobacterium phage Estes]YP_010013976.1 hypothetical protein J4U04_gp070 [Mycobacterium phage MrMagoo]APQ42174.1 hypothetical protein PBI_MRMAGOO_70 [Mycobacterium phage MrMagoo]ARM70249.1 hypothetical protein SEA_GARDENSALSA_69 [Mycobacterium phage GardenSalsa]QNL30778.1 hypothetical protein SEA_ESTES_69 [Mycobacterium phage Estes]